MPRPPPQDLSPESLLAAYASGAFPMADPGNGEVAFYTCDPRCILPLDAFHVPHVTRRLVRRGAFTQRVDGAFGEVIRRCSRDRGGENRSWISPELIEAYERLHALGVAHSVEAWREGRLVGGLYGVALGGAFFGESMFSLVEEGGSEAGKVCLVWLVERLRRCGFTLLDSQCTNQHVERFGAVEIPAAEYLRRLEAAIRMPARWA